MSQCGRSFDLNWTVFLLLFDRLLATRMDDFGEKKAESVTHFFRQQHAKNNDTFKTDDSCLVKCIDGDIKMSIFGFYHSDFFRRRVEGKKYF